MASRAGKTLVLAILGLVVAIAAVGCDSGAVNDVGQSSPAPDSADATQTPAPPSSDSPATPAAPGVPLEPLSAPPDRSLWALSPDSYDEGLEIEVEFEPYGVGPSSYGPSIVALVSAADPVDPRGRAPDLAGRNVVFILGDQLVKVGGRFTGVAVTRMQGDRIVVVLQDVKPATEP
jgi:hypothetical protein